MKNLIAFVALLVLFVIGCGKNDEIVVAIDHGDAQAQAAPAKNNYHLKNFKNRKKNVKK